MFIDDDEQPTLNIEPRRVGIYMHPNSHHGRMLFRGVTRFMRFNAHWTIHVKNARKDPLKFPLEDQPLDGLIGYFGSLDERQLIADVPFPVVNLANRDFTDDLVTVTHDDEKVGELAADYMWDLGFEYFGFCGDHNTKAGIEREQGFQNRIVDMGGHVSYHTIDFNQLETLSHESSNLEMRRWLEDLPKPIGIFATSDYIAKHILDMCHNLMYPTPQWVSVMGVGNDGMICELTRPPLTSIELNLDEVGYQGAITLNKLMNGETLEHPIIYIPPLHLIERESTEIMMLG